MTIEYHDANLVSINNEDMEQVFLTFINVSGQRFDTILHGVKHFLCENYRGRNIIFRMNCDSKNINVNRIESILGLNKGQKPEDVKKLLSLLENDELVYFRLESSYGATVTAICEKIEEREE